MFHRYSKTAVTALARRTWNGRRPSGITASAERWASNVATQEAALSANNGVFSSSAGDADTQALRLRSTRALWDESYTDESWIDEPVRLIPRLQEWIADNYPGTRLAITEYNWGALDDLNGALAQADVLGIFGREGLDLATLWDPPDSATAPGIQAFRLYRNYDGRGSGFGDVSVAASSTDQDRLALYAAQRSADNALTLVAINKTGAELTSALTLNGFDPAATATVYRYSAANLNAITTLPNQAVTAGGFSATFPANSITLFVIPRAGTSLYSLRVNKAGSGTVTSRPAGIDCGGTCVASFTAGTSVELVATPVAGFRFDGWNGACVGTASCQVAMTGAQSVTATFSTAGPDFVVSAVTLKPVKPVANRTFSAVVTVRNQGTVTGNGGMLAVWADQGATQVCGASGNAGITVGKLAAGASKNLTLKGLPAGAAGPKTLRAFVDSRCVTTETDESNNQFTRDYAAQ